MSLLLVAALLTQPAQQTNPKITCVPAKDLLRQVLTTPNAQRGIRWVDLVKAPGYSAVTLRRRTLDLAEVHTQLADIWYVFAGGGTLVTGGSPVQGSNTEPGEIRGRSIAGGESRHVAKGDFVAIPVGLPHWLSKIDGEIVYLIVKVVSHG